MHYKNGREARVGDQVVGKTYNRKDPVAGTLVTLTPGEDSCSAKVGFLTMRTFSEMTRGNDDKPFCIPYSVVAVQGTEQHGAGGVWALTSYEEDYTECGNLLHVEDAVKE